MSGSITTGLTASSLIQTNGSSVLTASNTLPSSCAATNMTLTTPTLSGTITTGLTASRLIQTNGSSVLTASNTLPTSCSATNMSLTTPTLTTASFLGSITTTLTASSLVQTNGSSVLTTSNTLPSSCAATNMTLTTPTMSGTTTTQAIVPVANNASAIGTAAKGYQGIYLSWVSYLGGADWIQGGASSPDIGTGWGFAVSNTYRAYITSSGLQLTGSSAIKSSDTSWTNPSDERLKQNITDFNKGLDVIDQIRCREFEYRNNPGKKIVGVIAQEMLDVYPECISTGANDMYNFDASDITFLLINSVKELKKQNKLLLSRIEELEKNAFVIL